MANPTARTGGGVQDFSGLAVQADQFLDANGAVIVTTRQATIANAEAAHSLTDADTNLGATTQAEIEGVLDALGGKINAILAALENAGILADS